MQVLHSQGRDAKRAKTADQANAEFAATLNPWLRFKEFDASTSASAVEQRLNLTIDAHIRPVEVVDRRQYARLRALRTLRQVLNSWRLLPATGGYHYGELVDKFDYGYTALQVAGNSDPESLEYQLVRCMTDEFKKYDVLTDLTVQGITDAATKMYLHLKQMIDIEGKGTVPSPQSDIGPEPEARVAVYEAVLIFPPTLRRKERIPDMRIVHLADHIGEEPSSPNPTNVVKRKRRVSDLKSIQQAGHKAEDTLDAGEPLMKQPRMKLKLMSSKSHELVSREGRSAQESLPALSYSENCALNNFSPRTAIRWNNEEETFAKQQIRQDPYILWSQLTQKINQRFQGTMFESMAKGNAMVMRGIRSENSVRSRFREFRYEMKNQEMDKKPGEMVFKLNKGLKSRLRPTDVMDSEDTVAKSGGDDKFEAAVSGQGSASEMTE